MAYEAIAVANEFIHLAKGKSLSPMKLQKLVYYAHGWHLALHDVPLIEERIEAWKFGPVIPELYREFRHCGDGEVKRPALKVDYISSQTYEPRIQDFNDSYSQSALNVIRSVWRAYRDYSATQLSNATHKPGTPWSKTYDPQKRSITIPDELIKTYFKAL